MIKRALKLLGFMLFTVVTTIVLAEMASRVLVPEWAPVGGDRGFWAYDPLLGWSLTPGASGRLEYVDFSVKVGINSDGLRDRDYPVERVPGKHRMLVLGDSFAWGYGVEQNERFSEVIENSRPDWEIINAGVSGYGTDQEYLYYKLRGSKYRPDVVLVLFFGNDLENVANSVQYYHNKPLFVADGGGIRLTNTPVPETTPSQRVANFVARNTYFLRIASQIPARWRSGGRQPELGQPAARGSAADEANNEVAPPSQQELVVRIFLALNEAVRAGGGRLVVVSLPGAYPLFKDPRFADAGISYLPLSGIFRGSPAPVWFAHDLHWTPNGHRIAAAAIDRYLEQIGVFDRDAGIGDLGDVGAWRRP
jgi:hypothetical protein